MTAAVTPVPQLLIMGFEESTPFDLKIFFNSCAERKVLSLGSSRSEIGTDIECGMCPDESPANDQLSNG